MIDVKHLYKSFGSLEVLKDVSLHVNKGEVVAIIGPSGSGKSTLLRSINLLETPTGGEIFVDGKSITAKDTSITVQPFDRMLAWYSSISISSPI